MGEFDHFRVDYKGKQIFVKNLPWYRKDKLGWPIETYEGKPFKSFVRIMFQNIRKVLFL